MSAGFRQRCQSPALQRVAAWLWLVCVLLVAVTPLGCAQKTLPAYGEVLLLLSSDMPVPESFDTVILTVNGKGRAFRAENPPKEVNAADSATECLVGAEYSTALSGELLALPTTVALMSDRDESSTAAVILIACKAGKLIFKRDFAVNMPESGQVKMVYAPIRWLCNDRSMSCYGCSDDINEVAPRCHHRNISLITARTDELCRAEACEDEPGTFETVDYVEQTAASYDPALAATDSCFDPWSCFDITDGSQFDAHRWIQVPTGWQTSELDAGSGSLCTATLQTALLDTDGPVNLALVLPPSGKGYCDKVQNRCFVPLDADSSVGWEWVDRSAGTLTLPGAVCHMLDSGQILYVVAATNADCAVKTPSTPLCRKRKNLEGINLPARLVVGATTYLPLDDAHGAPGMFLKDGARQPTLELVGNDSSPADAALDVAVMGYAGRFNNSRFAQGFNTDELKRARTLSAWVSLTEAAGGVAGSMPILSNISADCSSGARLELRACNDSHAAVVVALGLPSGQSTAAGCTLNYVFAPFSAKSYRGGFFTPWRAGTWFHVAATVDDGGDIRTARIFVDGSRADSLATGCPFPPTADEPHDGIAFYLGSQAALSTAAQRSHELLLDEVALFPHPLAEDSIRQLVNETSTVAGASGLRWGTWASQGSGARLDASTAPLTFIVDDRGFASAGSYALLAPNAIPSTPADLSEYDEAVLIVSPPPVVPSPPVVAGLLPDQPFQFSLVSDHGRRQCTWQLKANPAPRTGDAPEFETYVINLRKPSWCVDPQCKFDTRSVEQVSVGADWKAEQKRFDYSVKTLAFRKRPGSNTTSGILGGVAGPSGWCWKSVTYDAAWELDRPEQLSLAGTIPVSVGAPTLYGKHVDPPELAADLPDNLGSRDLRGCRTVKLGLDSLGKPVDSTLLTYDRQLAMMNEAGQTCSWSLPQSVDGTVIAQVDVSICNNPWPPNWTTPTADALLKAVTRVSVSYSGAMQISSVKCCTTTESKSCTDISAWPVAAGPS